MRMSIPQVSDSCRFRAAILGTSFNRAKRTLVGESSLTLAKGKDNTAGDPGGRV
jgi:hypothetical protein